MTGYGSGHMRQAISVGVVAFLRTIIKLTSIEMELKLTSVLCNRYSMRC